MNERKNNPDEGVSLKQTRNETLKPCDRSVEITGLGVIASLIMASWTMVGDGTLRLSDYLVFVAFVLLSAAGLAYRESKFHSQFRALGATSFLHLYSLASGITQVEGP